MIFLILFYEFFKAGLFAVGGGLATLPFLSDMADKYEWLTHEALADMIAVAESTPGPIGVNCATYAGYNAAGIPGALVATFALVLPSFIIISIISRMLAKYRSNDLVDSAFGCLRPAATGLIAAAAWSVIASTLFTVPALDPNSFTLIGKVNIPEAALFLILMILTNIKPLKDRHPIIFIGFAAVCGIAYNYIVA